MVEITDSKIDIERLMAEIRAAAERRKSRGERSLVGVSVELYERLMQAEATPAQSSELPPIKLQPEFVRPEDDHYHVNDLLKYHDHFFIWNAYLAILKREPDEHGLTQFLKRLRSGRFNKIDILASLRFSPEGESQGVTIDGLAGPARLRKLYRVPVLGYLLEMAAAIIRLPALVHSQRQFESYTVGQQERLADHLNQLTARTFNSFDAWSREIARTSQKQRTFVELQHQQIAALYREQRELLNHLRRMEAARGPHSHQTHQAAIPGAAPRSVPQNGEPSDEQRALDKLLASLTDEFRGRRNEIKERLRVYLPTVKEAGVEQDILDLGCGRGEWLELLQDEGLSASGVESNPVLVEQARAAKLEVALQDALEFLRGQPPASFGTITAFHFIEHLPFTELVELIDEVRRTLRPGGLVIFETPNPKNLVVAACNFYSDPTHARPVFPETLHFLLQQKGFVEPRIEYLNPVEGSPFLGDDDARSQALDSWLYGPRDFAVFGRKPAHNSPGGAAQ